MSSKRKNTPTKFAPDEVLLQRDRLENCSDGDSHNESGGEYDGSLPRSPVVKLHSVEGSQDGASSPEPDLDRPQTKKQRLLQSIRGSSDSETESDGITTHNHNNNLLTKPTSGLINSFTGRKSMDSVLRRLNNKASSESSHYHQRSMNGSPGSPPRHENGVSENDVMNSIKAAISNADSAEDKEKKLSEMIAQLSALKETIAKKKKVPTATLR